MPFPSEVLDLYADDELAILREERLNRLVFGRHLDRPTRADLHCNVGLIGRELAARRFATVQHRHLIKLTFQE